MNGPFADADRYPTLTENGRRMLEFMREHPHAPIFRNQSGNKLTAEEVGQARAFERRMTEATIDWSWDREPEWMGKFLARCLTDVPHYRAYGNVPASLTDLPTISRADLSRDITSFVPDDVPTDRLIHFSTSGTTGHPLLLPSHPLVAAKYLAFHKRALRRFGVELQAERGQVGVVLLGMQRKCFTYVSVTPTMDEAGLAKINLHPDDWRDPSDRAAYLDAMAPEVISGDPLSFAELLRLPLRHRPHALLSTSMTLLPAMRERLAERFACPVLDLYSMNEAGPLAVRDPHAGGHVLLQPEMFVEILDASGRRLPPGTRGEITLTGGFNFCLPLLRYRTGDYASLEFVGGEPVLRDFAGRPPVRFRTAAGAWLNNVDVTHALQPFAISQFTLRQRSDGSLLLRLARGTGNVEEIRAALLTLFGPEQQLAIEPDAHFEDKVVQYVSDLADAQP